MTVYVASSHTLTDIANAIRYHNGSSDHYAPSQMADAVAALSGTSETCGLQEGYKEIDAGMMSQVPYTSIANAIRGQNGSWDEYRPNQMAAAIRALEWSSRQAYAVAIPDASGSKYELHFLRADSAPVAGGIYGGKSIAYVYSGFEDAVYTSNSQVPWYSQHDNFTSVHFDDEVRPATCAYWFYMFRYCTSFDLDKLDVSAAASLAYMFYYCSAVTDLDLSGLRPYAATSMKYCFYTCNKLANLDVSGWSLPNMEDFTECFRGCSKLTGLVGLNTWYVSSACRLTTHMFNGCTALTSLVLGEWNLSSVTNASYMFQRMSNVATIDMSGCIFGTPANISYMFNSDGKLTTIYTSPSCDLSGATTKNDVFYNCYSLAGGAGSGLNNSTSLNKALTTGDYARVDGLGGKTGYFTAKS